MARRAVHRSRRRGCRWPLWRQRAGRRDVAGRFGGSGLGAGGVSPAGGTAGPWSRVCGSARGMPARVVGGPGPTHSNAAGRFQGGAGVLRSQRRVLNIFDVTVAGRKGDRRPRGKTPVSIQRLEHRCAVAPPQRDVRAVTFACQIAAAVGPRGSRRARREGRTAVACAFPGQADRTGSPARQHRGCLARMESPLAERMPYSRVPGGGFRRHLAFSSARTWVQIASSASATPAGSDPAQCAASSRWRSGRTSGRRGGAHRRGGVQQPRRHLVEDPLRLLVGDVTDRLPPHPPDQRLSGAATRQAPRQARAPWPGPGRRALERRRTRPRRRPRPGALVGRCTRA